jgi:hypothetical protein
MLENVGNPQKPTVIDVGKCWNPFRVPTFQHDPHTYIEQVKTYMEELWQERNVLCTSNNLSKYPSWNPQTLSQT